MTILWSILAVAFVLAPAALGVMLWTDPPQPARRQRVVQFAPTKQ